MQATVMLQPTPQSQRTGPESSERYFRMRKHYGPADPEAPQHQEPAMISSHLDATQIRSAETMGNRKTLNSCMMD